MRKESSYLKKQRGHVYKPSEIKVYKNSKGNWETVFVETDFNGHTVPYGSCIGYECSMYGAKRKFAEQLNRSNQTAKEHGLPWLFSVHKDYFLKSKKLPRR